MADPGFGVSKSGDMVLGGRLARPRISLSGIAWAGRRPSMEGTHVSFLCPVQGGLKAETSHPPGAGRWIVLGKLLGGFPFKEPEWYRPA